MLAAHLGGSRSFASVDERGSGWVTLPSGRALDLGRSRWDGVLDGEEFDYCRRHEIPLGYDCAQTGWVVQACMDDSRAAPTVRDRPVGADSVTVDPELRATELRGHVETDAKRMLSEVSAGRMSLDAAQQRLASAGTAVVESFAREHGLPLADLCHWTTVSAVAEALGAVRGPLRAPPPSSDTTAVTFRPWTANDAAVYVELLGNPAVWEYLPEPFPAPFTQDTARMLIEVAAMAFHHETVAIEVDDRPIGQCLLRFDQPFAGVRASEVAYWLGEAHWGKGSMSRILPVFTHRCFRRHNVDVIYAWIRNDNKASIRVAERAGYRRDPFLLESQLAESLRRPGFIRYATHRADWPDQTDDAVM